VHTLKVELGSRSYPILIGAGLLERPESFAALAARDLLIVSNTTVAPLYLHALGVALAPRRCVEVLLPDGEQHKTLANASRLLDVLVANRFGRDCTVLALGGAWSATSPVSPPPAITGASASRRYRPRSSRRSTRP